jgi:hypothetical protein
MAPPSGYVRAVPDLLIFDLIDELDGSLHNQGDKPLFELCLRLLQAPTPDAERAGEPLTVAAHERPDGTISFQIHGVETGRDWGSLDLGDVEWKDDQHRHEFVIGYAAMLRIALNGIAAATDEDERTLAELWRFMEDM